MRLARFIPAAALVLLMAVPAMAQAWIEYTDRQEMFRINFPGQPKIETFTYTSEYGIPLPAKRYTATTADGSKYMLTVIDYTGKDVQVTDVLGSYAYAAHLLRQRELAGKITFDAFAQIDRIPGHQLQITRPDNWRIYWAAHLEASRLYVLEADVPPGSPPAAGFQASLSVLDKEGNNVRYNIDANAVRTRTGQGGAAGRGGAAGGAGGGGARGGAQTPAN
jgi:hypothetical protein